MQDTEYCANVLHCLAYPSLLGNHRIMELEEDHVVQILLGKPPQLEKKSIDWFIL